MWGGGEVLQRKKDMAVFKSGPIMETKWVISVEKARLCVDWAVYILFQGKNNFYPFLFLLNMSRYKHQNQENVGDI